MKRVFISQPMKGLSNEEIKENRETIKKLIKNEYGEVEFIESFFEGAPASAKPLWFLGKSFELLSTADMAFFALGWDEARGCIMEHEVCIRYGIEIIRD